MQRSRFLLLLVIGLFLSTLALADSVVDMKLLGTGTNRMDGYYTYPYYFSINGGASTPLMCDSFNNHVSVGESWTAHVTGLLSGKGYFGNELMNYKAAGIIFLDVMNGTVSATVGNMAIWNLFAPGASSNSSVSSLDGSALSLAHHMNSSYFRGLVLYTPVGGSPGHGPQEYIGLRGQVLTAPEPGSMFLLGTGLMGIAGMVRRKTRRQS
ncbi:MAG: PEP-CTERM sorting domain-containing protein [Terriglobales bacterium]